MRPAGFFMGGCVQHDGRLPVARCEYSCGLPSLVSDLAAPRMQA
ncbi:MAG: hypothetical protein ABNH26_12100 [Celeribacter sp.]|jgi:hypothetical protein